LNCCSTANCLEQQSPLTTVIPFIPHSVLNDRWVPFWVIQANSMDDLVKFGPANYVVQLETMQWLSTDSSARPSDFGSMPSNQNQEKVQAVEVGRFCAVIFVVIRGNGSRSFCTSFFTVVIPDVGCDLRHSLFINEKIIQGHKTLWQKKRKKWHISWSELRRLASWVFKLWIAVYLS
jgi:hypothetical protein